jgi:hypothetical protein
LYAEGYLTYVQWKTALKMHGLCIPWQEKVALAFKNKPGIAECIQLLNAGKIDDEKFKEWVRETNWCPGEKLDLMKYLAKPIPGVAEIFDGVTRHINDDDVAEALGLDNGFDQLSEGNIGDWLGRVGMDNDVLKFRWRSHWRAADFRTVQRLYMVGIIDRDGMVARYKNAGFPTTAAENMADAIIKANWDKVSTLKGQRSAAELEKDYQVGHLSEDDYRQALTDKGCPQEQISDRVDAADERFAANEFKRMIGPLRRSFMKGIIDEPTYIGRLKAIGMDADTAKLVADNDNFVRDQADKPIAMQKLCSLVEQGYMTVDDYFKRATNFGYSQVDAMLLLKSCEQDIAVKQRSGQPCRDASGRESGCQAAASGVARTDKILAAVAVQTG